MCIVYLLERNRICLFWIVPLYPSHSVDRVSSTDFVKLCDRNYGGITKTKLRCLNYITLLYLTIYLISCILSCYGYSLFGKTFTKY